MDKVTPLDAVVHFSKFTSHWEPFLDSFTEKREIVFYELSDLSDGGGEAKEYWIKMGKMLAFDEMRKELQTIGEEALVADQKKSEE